jgi:hypothetical protein
MSWTSSRQNWVGVDSSSSRSGLEKDDIQSRLRYIVPQLLMFIFLVVAFGMFISQNLS